MNVLTWFALAIHWTVRDRSLGLSIIYYATPAVLLGAASLLTARLGFRLRCPKGSFSYYVNRILTLIGIFCLGEWVAVDFRGDSKEVTPDSIKVVFWNVGRGQFASWDRIARQVSDFDADVIALAEVTSDEVQTREFWKSRLPDYSAYPLKSGMLLLTKGTAVEQDAGSLGGQGGFHHLSVATGGFRFDVSIADAAANPLLPREQPIAALYEQIKEQHAPTLVMGDFNTPPSSVWFDHWRQHWTRAWEAAGKGYQPTWPQPLPVLALDHVWGNRGITFQRCSGGWSSCSDHRPVIVNIVVNETMDSR